MKVRCSDYLAPSIAYPLLPFLPAFTLTFPPVTLAICGDDNMKKAEHATTLRSRHAQYSPVSEPLATRGVGVNELLGRAHLAQCLRPLAHYHLPIHFFFFLPPNCARSPKRSHLTILFDGNARLPLLLSPGVPRHLIHFIQVDHPVFPFVFLHRSAHPDHPALVARIITNHHPVGSRFPQFLL